LISPEHFESALRANHGEDFWQAFCESQQGIQSLGGWIKPYSTGMGLYLPCGKRAVSFGYVDTGECPLHILSGRRLDFYEERDDAEWFTSASRQAYEKMLQRFPAHYKDSLKSDKLYGVQVIVEDVDEFRRFLSSILDFYKNHVLCNKP
jgi:hypothetical protein